MIYQTVSLDRFRQAFQDYGRSDNFSYEALEELYNFYDSLSDDGGQNIELDVIAICCECTEYSEEEFIEAFKHLALEADEDDLLCAIQCELNSCYYIEGNDSYLVMDE